MKKPPRRPYLAGLDSEDDGAGHSFLWCVVTRHGTLTARTRESALDMLRALGAKWKAKGYRLEVWATNLEYDLLNLFDRTHASEVTFFFGKSYLCSAKWKGIDFRDTTRHLPASVKDLGELVGLKKLHDTLFHGERPDPVKDFEYYRVRCQRDAAITYRAAQLLHRSYASLKVRARTTLASTALALWRDTHWKRAVVRPMPEVWSAAHVAYHGGRTQAFSVGTFERVTVIDVASMFPWAMTADALPLPWGLLTRWRPGVQFRVHGVYRARVHSALELPRLPVRTTRGTIYPNGTWESWYVGEELAAFERAGGRFELLDGYIFLESCRPFDTYVAALFRRKSHSRGLKRQLYKTMLNALYGKFGQQGVRVRCMSLGRYHALPDPPLPAREWNGLAIFTEQGDPPPWGNEVWPAFVTARARQRLADEIERLRQHGARVLYCDTDSIMFTGNGFRYPRNATRPGTFEIKGRYARMLLVGKKEYALETAPGKWLAHAKGVPLLQRYRYLTTGTAEFERPTRLREAAATGKVANVWSTVKKQRRVTLERNRDGTVPTPSLTE